METHGEGKNLGGDKAERNYCENGREVEECRGTKREKKLEEREEEGREGKQELRVKRENEKRG